METKSKYPFFQKGATLKSSDMNTMVDSIKLDDNGIRHLIGYGIIEGLEIKLGKEGITISAGCAVAPNGELLILKEDRILDNKKLEGKTGCLYIIKDTDKVVIDNPKDNDKNCGCDTNTNPINHIKEIEVDFSTDVREICGNLEICIPRWCDLISDKRDLNPNKRTLNSENTNEILQDGAPVSLRAARVEGSKNQNSEKLENSPFSYLVAIITEGYVKTANCFPACFDLESFKDLNRKLEELYEKLVGNDKEQTAVLICKLQYYYDYLKDLIAAQEEFLQYAHHIRRIENLDRVYLGSIATETNKCLYTPCREMFCHFENEKKAKFYACRMMKLADADVFGFPELPEEIFHVKEVDSKTGVVAALKYERIRITPSAALSRPLSERAIPFYLKEEIRPYWNYELTALHHYDSIPYFEEENLFSKEVRHPLRCDLAKYDFFRVEGYCGMDLEEVVRKIVYLRSRLNISFDIKIVVLNEKESYGIHTYYEDLQRQYAILRHQYLCQWQPSPNDQNQKIPTIPLLLLSNYNNEVSNCPSLAFELLKSDFDKRREDLIFENYKKKHPGLEHFAGVPNGGTLVLCVVKHQVGNKEEAEKLEEMKEETIKHEDMKEEEINENVIYSVAKAVVYNPHINYEVVSDFALPYRCCESDGVVECLLEEKLEIGVNTENGQNIAIISKGKSLYNEWRESVGKPAFINTLKVSTNYSSFAAMSYCQEVTTPINNNTVVFNVQDPQKNQSLIETFNITKTNNKWTRLTDVVEKFEKALLENDISILKGLEDTLSENAKLYELFQPVKTSLLTKLKKKGDIDLVNKIDNKLMPKL